MRAVAHHRGTCDKVLVQDPDVLSLGIDYSLYTRCVHNITSIGCMYYNLGAALCAINGLPDYMSTTSLSKVQDAKWETFADLQKVATTISRPTFMLTKYVEEDHTLGTISWSCIL